MLKTVAFYKCYSGHEWVEASIESIYDTVDTIITLHSEVSWCQERCNTTKRVIHEWKLKNDNQNKIVELDFNSTSQDAQYKYGIDYIKQESKCDVLMLIDSDEVWDVDILRRGLLKVRESSSNAFRTGMRTYVKSPFYRVYPDEMLKPMVFIKDVSSFSGVRGGTTPNAVTLDDIYFHHFTYVREDEKSIRKKIETSRDGENSHSVCLDWWIKEKWDNLPNATNFHPHPQYQHSWAGIKQVGVNDLPEACRDKAIVKKYMELV